MERHTTQNEAVGDGEYSCEVEIEMHGDSTETPDDFNMKNGDAGPSEHSKNDAGVVVIKRLDWELCSDLFHSSTFLKQVLCLNGICFPCFLNIQFLYFYVSGEKKSAKIFC